MIQEEFVNKILDILSSISNVSAIKDKRYIALYKDGVMFGKIVEQSVYLLNNGNFNPAYTASLPQVGSGSYGSVFRAYNKEDPSSELVAKIIPID